MSRHDGTQFDQIPLPDRGTWRAQGFGMPVHPAQVEIVGSSDPVSLAEAGHLVAGSLRTNPDFPHRGGYIGQLLIYNTTHVMSAFGETGLTRLSSETKQIVLDVGAHCAGLFNMAGRLGHFENAYSPIKAAPFLFCHQLCVGTYPYFAPDPEMSWQQDIGNASSEQLQEQGRVIAHAAGEAFASIITDPNLGQGYGILPDGVAMETYRKHLNYIGQLLF